MIIESPVPYRNHRRSVPSFTTPASLVRPRAANSYAAKRAGSGKHLDPDSITFVNRQRAPITGDKTHAARRSRGGDKRVVCGPASDVVVRQPKNEILVGARTEP